MRREKTKVLGINKFTLDVFEDHRGLYVETFNQQQFEGFVPGVTFVQDDFSCSKHNVLRGIHGDYRTWKLVHCSYGKIFLVVVDWRKESLTYKQWESFILEQNSGVQILIPPGFGNGHYVMSEYAVFSYKQSTYYDFGSQFSIPYNLNELGIKWPFSDCPILSQRDQDNA